MTSTRPATGSVAVAPPDAVARLLHLFALLALVTSAAITAFGLAWWLLPGWNPYATSSSRSLASALLDPAQFAAAVVATGAVGLVVAAAAASRGALDRRAPLIAGAAAVLTAAVIVVLGDAGTVTFAGYLFGFSAVVAGMLTTAVLVVRAPRLGVPLLALLAALIAVAVWWAGLTWAGVTTFLENLGSGLIDNALLILISAVSVAAVLAWTAVAVVAGRTTREMRGFEARLVRHRRAITVLAALGPLPYAFMRASWLTPWPLFAPAVGEMSPAVLATGLMLGSGAVAACVLTLGLILPWGRVFPRWMPRIGGRRVPAPLAVVPGLMAATIITISAVPLVLMSLDADSLLDAVVFNLVLPLWFWGPMLALAVWAYAAWRRGEHEAVDTGGALD
ncbi:hypothetical protein [Agromyces italicus]|uniref:hypothetical protein n=1 Tax=Agromyces italicus TaxID=279572 RepID=UPI0003B46252|nr:hypothetical protein [Agromyces italicus]